MKYSRICLFVSIPLTHVESFFLRANQTSNNGACAGIEGGNFNNEPTYNAKSKSGSSKSSKEDTGGKSSKKTPTEPDPVEWTCESLQNKKHCKKDVLCQWNKGAKKCSPLSAPVPNICLSNPDDIYRTCFQRAVDPHNDLTEDTVLRNEYNLGALMYQNGQESTVSTLSYLTPYTPPYTTADELLTYGSIYLSLVTNASDITCDDQLDLEQVMLEWLKASESFCKAIPLYILHCMTFISHNCLSAYLGQCWRT
jgi:hypothetical protein